MVFGGSASAVSIPPGRLAAWGQGEVNYTYGMENMSIRKVGQAYAQTYKQAING